VFVQEEWPTAEGDPHHTLKRKSGKSQEEPEGNKEVVDIKDEKLNQTPSIIKAEAK